MVAEGAVAVTVVVVETAEAEAGMVARKATGAAQMKARRKRKMTSPHTLMEVKDLTESPSVRNRNNALMTNEGTRKPARTIEEMRIFKVGIW